MQAGALDGDVIPLLLGIESAPLLLKAQILSGYATTTGGGDVGEREALGTIRESFGPLKKEIKRSIICHGLGHDYTMAAPSPFLHHGACSPPSMDPVGPLIRWYRQPHAVVNVSMCLLLFTAFACIKKYKRQYRETGCKRTGLVRINSWFCVLGWPL